MNHNPIPTKDIATYMLKVVDLTTVLKAIGHPDMLDDGVDAFSEISFGDAPYTLVPAERVGAMVEIHLSTGEVQAYTYEHAERIEDFFAELSKASVYVNMEG